MASSSSDLTLDDHHHLTAVAAASGQATQKLQEFLSRLEEERLKIDAFKRELPLCMQLLNHAMEAYRQQLEAYQMGSQHSAAAAAAARAPLVLEEFIPVKNIGIDVVAADKAAAAGGNSVSSEKASWMVSAQLWNAPASASAADTAAKGPQTPKEHSEHHPLDTSPKLIAALPELALAPAEKAADAITIAAGEVDKKPYAHDNGVVARSREAQNGGKPPSTPSDGQAVPPPPQPHRKARRCWSPELHRRFVNALQILGGAQVATPKQIRELMKVDGLTNDEVKSHLQVG
jgi:SHAQKYF class myb-like DNA-binding protein